MKKSYLLPFLFLGLFLTLSTVLSAQEKQPPSLNTQSVAKPKAPAKPLPQLSASTKAPNPAPKVQTPADQLTHMQNKLESMERKLNVLKADQRFDRSAAIQQLTLDLKDQKQQIKAFRKDNGLKPE
ncbi:MAG: hypothetical protein AAF598_05155 [Bacteroidota bacterium]